jgi:hypothetical protein
MMMSMRLRCFALAALFAIVGPAFAETPVEVATKWGLLGVWRLDCAAKPSRSDPDLAYVVRNGKLYHERNWGDGHDSSAIVSASVTPEGGIDLVVKMDSVSQTREFVDVKQDDGRIRAVMSRNVDTDEYAIRDGKLVSTGNLPPAQTHCSVRPPGVGGRDVGNTR